MLWQWYLSKSPTKLLEWLPLRGHFNCTGLVKITCLDCHFWSGHTFLYSSVPLYAWLVRGSQRPPTNFASKISLFEIWKLKDTRVDNIVRPQLSAEFEATKQQWLAWDKWSKGTRSGDPRSCSNSNVMLWWLRYVRSATMLTNKTAKKRISARRHVEEAEQNHLGSL